MRIISREEWRAEPARRIETTTPQEIYLHHTVGSGSRDKDGDGDLGDDYTKDVQYFHIHTRGWDDIAYNFLIDPDGLEVYEGQGWGREPNSQKGHNAGTWSVAVMGDWRNRTPSQALLQRIAQLVSYGQQLGELPRVPLQGHRDAPGSEGNTCPGAGLYSALPEINRLIEEDTMHTHQPPRSDLPRDWADESWDVWVEASGTDPESRTWDFYREDLAWVYTRVIRPLQVENSKLARKVDNLESKVGQLADRIRQAESGSVDDVVAELVRRLGG